MDEKLKSLIEAAKSVQMTRQDLDKQLESFAYGNTHIKNSRITKEMIESTAMNLKTSG